MWTCLKLAVADASLELRLSGAFRRAYRRAGEPADVAVFREGLGARGATFYFSPAAEKVAADAMSEMSLRSGPVPCERPAHDIEQVFGTPETWRRLFDG